MTNQLTMLGGDVGSIKPANLPTDPITLSGSLNGATQVQASAYQFLPSLNNLFGGTGAPAAGLGSNGDIYFRVDGAALSTIYQKRVGAWTGIV